MNEQVKPLWESTRDLHHACESHAVGGAMSKGTPPRQWYSDWLGCLSMMHEVTDTECSEMIHRADRVKQDIEEMDVKPRFNKACEAYCEDLKKDADLRQGALYVLTGAHLMGGEIMRRRLVGFPVKHLEWVDRQAALGELKKYRERPELTPAARACFEALLRMMDEIQAKGE